MLLRQVVDNASVDIGSVDAFQGFQKDVIVLSTVRSNQDGSIGFLDDPRRMSVAMTRARCGFVVVGNKDTLMSSFSCWVDWLSWVEDKNLLVDATAVFDGCYWDADYLTSVEERMLVAMSEA